jgi:hypothetical protein
MSDAPTRGWQHAKLNWKPRLATATMAWTCPEAERLVAAVRAAKIADRVALFVEQGPSVSLDAATPMRATQRGRLLRHRGWLDNANRNAAATASRLESISVAVARHEAAQKSLVDLDAAAKSAFESWVQFARRASARIPVWQSEKPR